MVTQIDLGEMRIDVVRKDIKNVHLSVYPPAGRVRISAPSRMSLDTIRVFAISKLGWIRKQQRKLREQERETPREYIDRESHYLWGNRYLLQVIYRKGAPRVVIHSTKQIDLYVREGSPLPTRERVMTEWYRQQLKAEIPTLIAKWEKIIGVEVAEWGVKQMKTRWGTCNTTARRIWLNLELAKKPPQCLEYVVVHELVHLLERRHNNQFVVLMDRFLPQWRIYRDDLNRFPVRHEEWGY